MPHDLVVAIEALQQYGDGEAPVGGMSAHDERLVRLGQMNQEVVKHLVISDRMTEALEDVRGCLAPMVELPRGLLGGHSELSE